MHLLPYISPASTCGWLPIPDEPAPMGVTADGDLVLDVRSASDQGGGAVALIRDWAQMWRYHLPRELDGATVSHVLKDLAAGVLAALSDDAEQESLLREASSGAAAELSTERRVLLSGIVVAAALTDLFDGPFESRTAHGDAVWTRLCARGVPAGYRDGSSGTCAA